MMKERKAAMTFNDLARRRYSCRKLAAKPVEQEKLDAIIEAGVLAPTAVNRQPFRIWVVKSPDAIKASDDKGATIVRYAENNIPAGIASSRNGYKTVVVGFPFETIKSENERNEFMERVLNFFENK